MEYPLTDARLSLAAKGLYALWATRKDSDNIKMKDVREYTRDNPGVLRMALMELKKFGYIKPSHKIYHT